MTKTSNENQIVASLFTAINQAVIAKRESETMWDDGDSQRFVTSLMTELPTTQLEGVKKTLASLHYEDEVVTTALGVISIIVDQEENLIANLCDINYRAENNGFAASDVDTDTVNALVAFINPASTSAPAQGTPMSAISPAPATSAFQIPKDQVTGVNALISAVSGGKITDINAVLTELDDTKAVATKLKQDLAKALTAASRVPVPTTGKDNTGLGELTYEVITRKVGEVLEVLSPTGVNLLATMNIEVPTLVWKDKAGNIVEHPETPNVDPNYMFNPIQIVSYLTAMDKNMNTWLYGHTGTGKSTFVEQVAARIGWPVTRINLDANLERPDLVGQITLTQESGATISTFEEGVLPRAMQRPGILLMDEIDAGRPDILFVVQRALENKGLLLTEDNGRVVQPHPLFRFAATANTRGQGDEYGMYGGTRTMNGSLIDRFSCFLEFQYMEAKAESALLIKFCPTMPQNIADSFAQFAAEVRKAFSKGEVYNTISPRGLKAMAELFCFFSQDLGMDEEKAISLAMTNTILNKVTNDTRQKFSEISQRVIKVKKPAASGTTAKAA